MGRSPHPLFPHQLALDMQGLGLCPFPLWQSSKVHRVSRLCEGMQGQEGALGPHKCREQLPVLEEALESAPLVSASPGFL